MGDWRSLYDAESQQVGARALHAAVRRPLWTTGTRSGRWRRRVAMASVAVLALATGFAATPRWVWNEQAYEAHAHVPANAGAPLPDATQAADSAAIRAALPALEKQVEQLRGHRYRTAVNAVVLSKEDFVADLDSDGGEDTGRASSAVAAGQAGSVGAYDKQTQQLDDDLTVGFYDNGLGELFLRSASLDGEDRTVIVHELTHALDDQLFDLGQYTDPDNTDHDDALSALVEGDATEVEQRFLATLPLDQRCPAEDDLGDPLDSECATFLNEPPGPAQWDADASAVDATNSFPYDYGAPFIAFLLRHGGSPEVDAAFRRPPESTEQVLDPQTYLAADHPVAVPRPAAQGTVLASGTEGEFALSLLLVGGRPAALDGWHLQRWGGDSYVTYHDAAGGTCLRDAIAMDTAGATDDLLQRARGWLADSTEVGSVTRTAERRVLLTACSK